MRIAHATRLPRAGGDRHAAFGSILSADGDLRLVANIGAGGENLVGELRAEDAQIENFRCVVPFYFLAVAQLEKRPRGYQINACIAAREVAHPAPSSVVPARLRRPADAAMCFFARRASVITRACGSPKTPRTVVSGRKPVNVYASHSRRLRLRVGIGESCRLSAKSQRRSPSGITGRKCISGSVFTHTSTR